MASRFPRVWLRHTVQLAEYTGWNSWAQHRPVKCLVDELVTEKLTSAGKVVRKSVQIFAPLESGQWPEGSKIVLADGRAGYVTTSVRRAESMGMALPAHVHVFTDFPAVASSPAGETVVLLRKVRNGVDHLGNNRYTVSEVPLPGSTVSHLDSTEETDRGSQLIVTATVIVAPGTVVTQVDQLRVRGLVYDVVGVGEVQDDPTLGGNAGVKVSIKRVTG